MHNRSRLIIKRNIAGIFIILLMGCKEQQSGEEKFIYTTIATTEKIILLPSDKFTNIDKYFEYLSPFIFNIKDSFDGRKMHRVSILGDEKYSYSYEISPTAPHIPVEFVFVGRSEYARNSKVNLYNNIDIRVKNNGCDYSSLYSRRVIDVLGPEYKIIFAGKERLNDIPPSPHMDPKEIPFYFSKCNRFHNNDFLSKSTIEYKIQDRKFQIRKTLSFNGLGRLSDVSISAVNIDK